MEEVTDMLQLQQADQRIELRINYGKIKMVTNLVPNEPTTFEDSPIDIVDTYAYLDHEIRLTTDNQTCELLRTISLGSAAFKANCLLL